MKVLHLSDTPLVGAPLRISRALNRLPGVTSRAAVWRTKIGVYETLAFDTDLRWEHDRVEIVKLAQEADVLHLHQTVRPGSQEFPGLDLAGLAAAGVPLLRHFHSTPQFLAALSGQSVAELLACRIPRVVIAQHPERFVPDAALVPNIVFAEDAAPVLARSAGQPLRIGYAPSRFNTARSSRWDTKGYPETLAMLREVVRRSRRAGLAIEVDCIENTPHAECLNRKAACDVVLDDLVTGSYHLNTLESLVAGRAVITYLDARTQVAQEEITGGHRLPVLNLGLECAAEVLIELAREPAIARQLGEQAATWMRKHWSPEVMAARFVAIYQQVISQPSHPLAYRFDPGNPLDRWNTQGGPDALWRQRSQYWAPEPSRWRQAFRSAVWRAARRLRL